MNDKTKKLLVKIGAVLLAFVLVAGVSALSRSTRLKANTEDETAGEETAVQEPAVSEEIEIMIDDIAEEEALPEEKSEEEQEPQTESGDSSEEEEDKSGEEEKVQEESEKEEPFDIVKAYEYYKSLNDAERVEYLNSLSEENRAMLLEYIAMVEASTTEEENTESAEEPAEQKEAEEQEEKTDEDYELNVDVWYENVSGGQITYGSIIKWCSSVGNAKEGSTLTYQWQYMDGSGWHDMVGANSAEYIYTIDETNADYAWRVFVNAE